MTERALQRKVLTKLKGRGVWINKSPSRWDRRGIVDIIGCYNGRFVAVELKQPGKYKDARDGLDEAQERFLRRVHAAGGIAVCADSWETVDYCLAKLTGNVYPDSGSAAA